MLSDAVRTGLWLAYALNLPLVIAGREMRVPQALGESCRPAECDEDGEPNVVAEALPGFEMPRRVAYLMAAASAEIAESGLSLGLLEPPAPAPAARTWTAPAGEVEDVEPVIIAINETTVRVGAIDVRCDDGLNHYLVRDNNLLAWHASKAAALADAVARAKDAPGNPFHQGD